MGHCNLNCEDISQTFPEHILFYFEHKGQAKSHCTGGKVPRHGKRAITCMVVETHIYLLKEWGILQMAGSKLLHQDNEVIY